MNEQQILQSLQNEMVQRAEQLVRGLNLNASQGFSKGRTQASRAIEVAQTTTSLPIFVNWLRYQAGRERSADFWTRNTGSKSLALTLTQELQALYQKVAEKAGDVPETEVDRIAMRAATRFLGYMRRALIGAEYLDEIRLTMAGDQ